MPAIKPNRGLSQELQFPSEKIKWIQSSQKTLISGRQHRYYGYEAKKIIATNQVLQCELFLSCSEHPDLFSPNQLKYIVDSGRDCFVCSISHWYQFAVFRNKAGLNSSYLVSTIYEKIIKLIGSEVVQAFCWSEECFSVSMDSVSNMSRTDLGLFYAMLLIHLRIIGKITQQRYNCIFFTRRKIHLS